MNTDERGSIQLDLGIPVRVFGNILDSVVVLILRQLFCSDLLVSELISGPVIRG